jgi:hypothetical protein
MGEVDAKWGSPKQQLAVGVDDEVANYKSYGQFNWPKRSDPSIDKVSAIKLVVTTAI